MRACQSLCSQAVHKASLETWCRLGAHTSSKFLAACPKAHLSMVIIVLKSILIRHDIQFKDAWFTSSPWYALTRSSPVSCLVHCPTSLKVSAGGTEDVLRRFLRSFEDSPAAMLGAFEPLCLPSAMRHTTLVSLQAAVKACYCPTIASPGTRQTTD